MGSPYGTENLTEEEVLGDDYRLDKNNFGTHNSPDIWDARKSAVASNSDSWYPDDNINRPSGRQLMYKQVVKACMSRNRDLNGDGTINAEEVRWYLASVGQYRGLWYGESALKDPDARLFREDLTTFPTTQSNQDNGKYHCFTSSNGTNYIFWSEEGLSTSDKDNNIWQYASLVRCVRTLKSNDAGLEEADKYYTYNNNMFDLNGLEVTRNKTTTTLPIHKERDEANGLYSKIKVAERFLTSGMYYNTNSTEPYTVKNNSRPDDDPCVKYYEKTDKSDINTWRMPNQKELGLLGENGLINDSNVICRTDYSGKTENGKGYKSTNGFWWLWVNNITLGDDDYDLKFRCVKDIQ